MKKIKKAYADIGTDQQQLKKRGKPEPIPFSV
jgi:hypothetical protein